MPFARLKWHVEGIVVSNMFHFCIVSRFVIKPLGYQAQYFGETKRWTMALISKIEVLSALIT